MKPSQPSQTRTSLRWQPSPEVVTGEATGEEGEERQEAPGEVPEVADNNKVPEVADDPEVADNNKVEEAGPGTARDTPPIHQKVAVTAIMLMEPTLGTAWHPTPAPGRTNVHQDPEKLTNLEIKIVTKCFPALIL